MDTQTPANVQAKTGKEPDPSVLTTQALWREVAALKELLFFRIDAIEKAVSLAHVDKEKFPTDIDKAIGQLKALHEERFKAVDLSLEGEHNLKEEKFNKVEQRFNFIETTRIEQKQEAANALSTALQAAKELINEQSKNTIAASVKSETAITKQIDQQGQIIQSIYKSLEDKIGDIKDRLTRIEGVSTGKRDFWGYIVGAIGLLATLATLIGMMIRNSVR